MSALASLRKVPGKRSARPYHHGRLRDALLEAAWAIISEEGVGALTLRACARRAGVSHAAPANHFESVAALVAELAAEGYERLAAVMDQVAAEMPKELLRAAGLGYIRFAHDYPEHFRLMSHVRGAEGASTRLDVAAEATKRRLEDALRGAYLAAHQRELPASELSARAILAWSAVHGYSILRAGPAASSAMPDPDTLLRQLGPALIAA